MDDRLARIEAGLERLAPRGLSDTGKAALDARIEELAEGVDESGGRHGAWRWGIAAAAVAMLAGSAMWQKSHEAPPAVVEDAPVMEAVSETVSVALQVNDRFDGGWIYGDGSQVPFRYHGYEVTDEMDIVDEETGYEVQVRELREEWIPVTMTSL